MISIRKFVGYAGAAAGIGAALTFAMSTQTAFAATLSPATSNESIPPVTLSAQCTAAIQNVKSAFLADVSEDRIERAAALIDQTSHADQTEDSTEVANFKSLFAAVRTACAPAEGTSEPAERKTFTPSTACTTALQNLKAAWEARPATQAQWTQLKALALAARTACGWTWTGTQSWSDVR